MARIAPIAMRNAFSIVLVLSTLQLWLGSAHAACYFPNGDTDSGHEPCGSGSSVVCCSKGFQCLSNGLCGDPRYDNYRRVLRGGCTDSGWGGSCPSFCKDSKFGVATLSVEDSD